MAPRQSFHDAETLAVQALGFLASEPERIGPFLAATGLDPANLRAAAGEPGFLAAVLDFLLDHEPTLLDAAHDLGVPAERIVRLRRCLPGAAEG